MRQPELTLTRVHFHAIRNWYVIPKIPPSRNHGRNIPQELIEYCQRGLM